MSTGAAFVAGGSGGAGRLICDALAASGRPVAFTYHRNRQAADDLSARMAENGAEVEAYELDLRDAAAVRAVLEAASGRFGSLHTVVYAAGPMFDMAFVSTLSPEAWAEVFAIDVNGCFNLVSAALPHLRANGGGSLVALSTCAVRRPPKADVLSAAPKAAIEMLVKCTAKEEGRNGVRANLVELGFIDVGMTSHALQHEWSPELVAKIVSDTPLRRLGDGTDVAHAVAFLCSDEARFVTGQSLAVDGGFSL